MSSNRKISTKSLSQEGSKMSSNRKMNTKSLSQDSYLEAQMPPRRRTLDIPTGFPSDMRSGSPGRIPIGSPGILGIFPPDMRSGSPGRKLSSGQFPSEMRTGSPGMYPPDIKFGSPAQNFGSPAQKFGSPAQNFGSPAQNGGQLFASSPRQDSTDRISLPLNPSFSSSPQNCSLDRKLSLPVKPRSAYEMSAASNRDLFAGTQMRPKFDIIFDGIPSPTEPENSTYWGVSSPQQGDTPGSGRISGSTPNDVVSPPPRYLNRITPTLDGAPPRPRPFSGHKAAMKARHRKVSIPCSASLSSLQMRGSLGTSPNLGTSPHLGASPLLTAPLRVPREHSSASFSGGFNSCVSMGYCNFIRTLIKSLNIRSI